LQLSVVKFLLQKFRTVFDEHIAVKHIGLAGMGHLDNLEGMLDFTFVVRTIFKLFTYCCVDFLAANFFLTVIPLRSPQVNWFLSFKHFSHLKLLLSPQFLPFFKITSLFSIFKLVVSWTTLMLAGLAQVLITSSHYKYISDSSMIWPCSLSFLRTSISYGLVFSFLNILILLAMSSEWVYAYFPWDEESETSFSANISVILPWAWSDRSPSCSYLYWQFFGRFPGLKFIWCVAYTCKPLPSPCWSRIPMCVRNLP